MQNTDIFINPRQSATFSNSIFHLEEKVTNYLFISHSKINKIASRADDVINSCQTSVLFLYKGATLVDNRAHGHYTLMGSLT